MFGLSQKVKLFSVQPKLSSRGLSYLCRVQSTGISLSLWLSLGWAKSSDWAVAETKQKIRLQFLAHLRLISGSGLCSVLRPHQHSIGYMEEGVLGSAKRLSHGLSQKWSRPLLNSCSSLTLFYHMFRKSQFRRLKFWMTSQQWNLHWSHNWCVLKLLQYTD